MISVTQVGRCLLCNPLIKEREESLFDVMIFFQGTQLIMERRVEAVCN